MRIALFSALFPPHVVGGAERSAASLARRLGQRGHAVAVLSTATGRPEAAPDAENDGIAVRRAAMPRPYPALDFAGQSRLRKLVWHAQDHLDPRNRRIWGRFLDDFSPDFASVHVAQGLGYNGLLELARRDVPVLYVLHDLSLACFRTTMFRGGRPCAGACPPCRASGRLKLGYLLRIPRLGLVSPSRATYEAVVAALPPLRERPHRIIRNANGYPAPPKSRPPEAAALRLLYAGQVSRAKGVAFLLGLADRLAEALPLHMQIVGDGPDLALLKSEYGDRPWTTFSGHVPQDEVSRIMGTSDLLCVPSLWPDNSPGVIFQAFAAGLPVVGSRIGGIPELVEPGATGMLLPPGDASAWAAAIRALGPDRPTLARWSAAARRAAAGFDPEASVDGYLDFAHEIMALPARRVLLRSAKDV